MILDKRQRRLRALRSQIQRLDRCVIQLQRKSDQLTRWRLAIFALLLVVSAVVLLTLGALAWAVITVVLLIPFLLTVGRHRQVEKSIARHFLWQRLKKAQYARMVL